MSHLWPENLAKGFMQAKSEGYLIPSVGATGNISLLKASRTLSQPLKSLYKLSRVLIFPVFLWILPWFYIFSKIQTLH